MVPVSTKTTAMNLIESALPTRYFYYTHRERADIQNFTLAVIKPSDPKVIPGKEKRYTHNVYYSAILARMYWYLRTLIKLFLGKGVDKSYSQFGEDMAAKVYLRGIKKGTYVDIGCADPVLYSNTYHFYKKGWKGVCYDPNPFFAARYRLLRPRDVFICAGIGKPGRLTYHMFNDESYNTFSHEDADKYLQRKSLKLIQKVEVDVRPLRLEGISQIDFMNIDVQGLDLEVLETYDWSITPTVIAVEDEQFDATNPSLSGIYRFLTTKGYELKAFTGLTLIFKIQN